MPVARQRPARKPEVKVIRTYSNPTTAASRKLDEQSLRFWVDGKEFAILSLPAVARRLDCTQVRVTQLVREGKLDGYRFGRVWVVTETALDNYIKGRRGELRRRYQSYLDEEFLSERQPVQDFAKRPVRVVSGQKPR
jgi:excisionase family DNA binding protein